jgi:hypothetical protein
VIEAIQGAPPDVLAFKAVGEVRFEDYRDVVEPAAKAAIAAGRKIRVVFLVGSECTGYSAGAMWADAKLSLGELRHLKRCAVVTNHAWVKDSIKTVRWMAPTRIRLFGVGEVRDAMSWAAR